MLGCLKIIRFVSGSVEFVRVAMTSPSISSGSPVNPWLDPGLGLGWPGNIRQRASVLLLIDVPFVTTRYTARAPKHPPTELPEIPMDIPVDPDWILAGSWLNLG